MPVSSVQQELLMLPSMSSASIAMCCFQAALIRKDFSFLKSSGIAMVV